MVVAVVLQAPVVSIQLEVAESAVRKVGSQFAVEGCCGTGAKLLHTRFHKCCGCWRRGPRHAIEPAVLNSAAGNVGCQHAAQWRLQGQASEDLLESCPRYPGGGAHKNRG